MEMLIILIWKMRQDRLFHTSRAQIQATISSHKDGDKEAIKEAYDDLRDAFFPYNKNERGVEVKQLRELMMREIARGPLAVTVKADPMEQLKIAKKLARGQESLEKRAALLRSGNLQRLDPASRVRQGGRRVS